MNVITLLNEKGGVGKTTVSRHIAAGLAIKGARVVLLDADAQANSTSQFQLEEENGMYELLVHDAEWSDVLRPVPLTAYAGPEGPAGELVILPSNVETRLIPMAIDDTTLLNERIQELKGWADYVVIDTSPTPSLLHGMIYMATNYMIYPTTCELLSLEGLNKSVGRLEVLNRNKQAYGLPEAHFMGVQPTMYDPRTNAHDYGLGLVVGEFKRRVWPAIPTRTIWRDAAFARKTVFAYDTKDSKAKEEVENQVWAMVDRVTKGVSA
ncbi:MAG: AAA family ATPase [Anaerolineae bacterium]